MSIYTGTSEIKNVYIGTTPVKEVYVGTNKVRPSGWKPGANTVAYYPLTSSSQGNDMKPSGTKYNLTNTNVSFGTYQGVNCAAFTGNNSSPYSYLRYSNFYNLANGDYTINFRAYKLTQTHPSGDAYVASMGSFTSTYRGQSMIVEYDNNRLRFAFWFDDCDSDINPSNQRVNIGVKFKKSTNQQFIYVNGVLRNSRTTTYTHSLQVLNLIIGGKVDIYGNYEVMWHGYLSKIIFEKTGWSDAEILAYYNLTKSNYGL